MIYLTLYVLIGAIFSASVVITSADRDAGWPWYRYIFPGMALFVCYFVLWPIWAVGLSIKLMRRKPDPVHYCAWCGDETVDWKDPDAVRAHIMACDGHPMRAEVVRLRAALEFYADEDIYFDESPENVGDHDDTIAMVDNGKKAREALGGEK